MPRLQARHEPPTEDPHPPVLSNAHFHAADASTLSYPSEQAATSFGNRNIHEIRIASGSSHRTSRSPLPRLECVELHPSWTPHSRTDSKTPAFQLLFDLKLEESWQSCEGCTSPWAPPVQVTALDCGLHRWGHGLQDPILRAVWRGETFSRRKVRLVARVGPPTRHTLPRTCSG